MKNAHRAVLPYRRQGAAGASRQTGGSAGDTGQAGVPAQSGARVTRAVASTQGGPRESGTVAMAVPGDGTGGDGDNGGAVDA